MQNTGTKTIAARRRLGLTGCGVLLLAVLIVLTGAIPGVAADPPPAATTGASAPQRVRFSGNGFATNEMLSFWLTAPDHSVTPLDGAQADNLGGFTVSITLPTDGMWQVTAHGLTSKHEIVSRYAVGQVAAMTATDASTAPATATAQTTGGIYPHAVVGQAVTIPGNAFGSSENVSAWETSPSGEVKALDGIQAQSNGQFTVKVTFDTVGFWQVTFHGTTSGHESVRGYIVDALPGSTAASAAILSTALSGANATIVLPTFTPTAETSAGTGQQLVTPSPAQLTPPALALQPPTDTPTAAP